MSIEIKWSLYWIEKKIRIRGRTFQKTRGLSIEMAFQKEKMESFKRKKSNFKDTMHERRGCRRVEEEGR